MEEDRSSAHHFRIFPRQKKLLCTWSEMYILCFHFVGQLCCYYRVDMLLPLGSRKVRLLIVTAYLLLLIISAVKAKGGKKVCLTYVCQKHQVQCYFQFCFNIDYHLQTATVLWCPVEKHQEPLLERYSLCITSFFPFSFF